jgi:HK97 gp10 family phage protein
MYQSRLPRIVADLNPKVDAICAGGANLIKDGAKNRVPVRTSRLHDAIHVEHDDGGSEWAVVAGNDEVFYGHIVEHGSTHTPAHPFMIPALEESRNAIDTLAAAVLETL